MILLIDMNLSPDRVVFLAQKGWQAIHWSRIGSPCATDADIMTWARLNEHVVFTHDLDFGTLLATTHVQGPSVIQIRTQDIMPQSMGKIVVDILLQYQSMLEKGALITVDETKSRIRVLPI